MSSSIGPLTVSALVEAGFAMGGSSYQKAYTAAGTATAMTVDISGVTEYWAGRLYTVVPAAGNSGAATTVSITGLAAKPLYKPNTTSAPVTTAGKPITFYDSGESFFLLASAEGTALAAHVLPGYTFSNDNDTAIPGAMPTKSAATITPSGVQQTIASGQYLLGTQTIRSLGGDAVADEVLEGVTFSSDIAGREVTGTIPMKNTASRYL